MTESGLDAFLATVERGSFAAAAEALFITQPALSQRISALESDLGYPLFERSKGRRFSTLTEQGREFLPIAEKWKELYDRALAIGTKSERPRIEMAAIGCISHFLMPSLLKKAAQDNSPYSIDMRVCLSRECTSLVADGTIGLGLVEFFYEQPIQRAKLLTFPLFSCDFDLVVGPDWKLGDCVSPEDLDPANEIWIPWSTGIDAWHEHWFDSSISPRMRLHHVGYLTDAISGELFAFVPHFVTEKMLERGVQARVVKLKDGPSKHVVSCITTETERAKPSTAQFLEDLLDEVRAIDGVTVLMD